MMKKIVLSIVIVNYNTRDLILDCLRALKRAKTASDVWEVIVVDNGSTDDSSEVIREDFPQVILLTNKTNVGYTKANNQGIAKAKGDFILLLNSDTEVSPGAIQKVLTAVKVNNQVGAGTAKLVLGNGQLDPACHRGFPTPWAALTYLSGLEKLFPKSHWIGQYHEGYKDLSKAHEIECPSGAFFLIRREVVDEVGHLDEDFFMYGEDIDWAYRIRQKGWKIIFVPEAIVTHHKKQSGRSHVDQQLRRKTQVYFYETMQIFYRKHYRAKYPAWLTGLINLTISFLLWQARL